MRYTADGADTGDVSVGGRTDAGILIEISCTKLKKYLQYSYRKVR